MIQVIGYAHPGHHPSGGLSACIDPNLSLVDFHFALMHKQSTIYDSLRQLFRESGFYPLVLFETRSITILEMVAAGLCCSIVPDAESLEYIEGVSFFCLDTHPRWNLIA